MKDQTFILPDGRQLGYCTVGEGKPVLYFHGTASSRLEVLLLKELAFDSHLQIVGVDRPGFGLSTPVQKKTLRGFAEDVNRLIEALRFNRVAVLGLSGGGAFELAYVALFPERVSKCVVVGAPALPFDVATAHNRSLARFAMKFPWIGMLVMNGMRSQVLKANADIDGFLASKKGRDLLKSWCSEDTKFFSDKAWLALMYKSMAEAFRQGKQSVKAVLQEHQMFMKTWDVPLTGIPSGKVVVWQGTDDKTCRVDNAYRIADAVSGAQVEILTGEGHCVMFNHLDKLGEILRA